MAAAVGRLIKKGRKPDKTHQTRRLSARVVAGTQPTDGESGSRADTFARKKSATASQTFRQTDIQAYGTDMQAYTGTNMQAYAAQTGKRPHETCQFGDSFATQMLPLGRTRLVQLVDVDRLGSGNVYVDSEAPNTVRSNRVIRLESDCSISNVSFQYNLLISNANGCTSTPAITVQIC